MKSSQKSGGAGLLGFVGAFIAWLNLIQLFGAPDPIFGTKEGIKWAAAGVILGIWLMTAAVAFSVKHFNEDDDDSE